MNKNSKEYQRVREQIVEILKEVYWEEFDYSQPGWKEEGAKWFKTKADQILNINGIVTLADDQELPPIPREDICHIIMERDNVLLKAGFKKVI